MYFLSLGWAQLQQDITAKNEDIRTVEAENAKLYQQLMDKELVKLQYIDLYLHEFFEPIPND